ncbi:NADP-dependent oxidoreductase domain-containing protein [Mycena galopus ATCC 62051]|nr:NADP-dependent oxidoreductase domain-containing protein [Mycena galopus ATCC 62051]
MPWTATKLNDGAFPPGIYLNSNLDNPRARNPRHQLRDVEDGNGDAPITQIDQAISVGFSHIGAGVSLPPHTAQLYRNEAEAGVAIRESGLAHKEIFITLKYFGVDGLDIKTSIHNSLKNATGRKLGVTYVDLYLIHHPVLATPDIPTAWSIGVSNFEVKHLAILLASAKVKPVANQILLHPYVYARRLPILEYAAKHKIVIEAYSALIPITSLPGDPVDAPVGAIADRLSVSADQVLLAWTKAKGAVVSTYVSPSSKKERLLGYLNAGNLELTEDDIAAIDAAGAKGPPSSPVKRFLRRPVAVAAVSTIAGLLSGYLRIC